MFARPLENSIPYQGNSMLPGTASAPSAASRAGGGSERKSSLTGSILGAAGR